MSLSMYSTEVALRFKASKVFCSVELIAERAGQPIRSANIIRRFEECSIEEVCRGSQATLLRAGASQDRAQRLLTVIFRKSSIHRRRFLRNIIIASKIPTAAAI